MRSTREMIFCSMYSSAVGRDLWNALQKSSDNANLSIIFPKGFNLTSVMETWEHQAGIPVLSVIRKNGTIQFSQV